MEVPGEFHRQRVSSTLTINATLSSREQIQVEVCLVALGRLKANLFTPFTEDGPYRAALIHEVNQLAQATVRRWALRLHSAEKCLSQESYDSLEAMLHRMTSPDLTVHRVRVLNIVPITPRLPPPVIRKEEPEHPLAVATRSLAERSHAYDELLRLLKETEARYPDLFNDSKHGQRIKAAFEEETLAFLLQRRTHQ